MILFIHNPHTGGTALVTELRRRGQLANNWDWNHMSAREWQLLYPALWDKHKKLAVVRNPWDRLVAIYSHEIRRFDYMLEFDDWLFNPPRKLLHPFDYRRISQFDYLKTIEGTIDYRVLEFEKDLEKIPPYHHFRGPVPGMSRKKPHYSQFYSEKSKQWVEIFFSEDIDRWGYSFEEKTAEDSLIIE